MEICRVDVGKFKVGANSDLGSKRCTALGLSPCDGIARKKGLSQFFCDGLVKRSRRLGVSRDLGNQAIPKKDTMFLKQKLLGRNSSVRGKHCNSTTSAVENTKITLCMRGLRENCRRACGWARKSKTVAREGAPFPSSLEDLRRVADMKLKS